MLTLGGFAAIALVLAAVGIFGVLSYSVSARRRDIRIRMALGATPRDVLGAVVRQGMRLTAMGLVLGIVGAFFLSRLLQSLLFRVGPRDLLAFIGTTGLLLAVAMIAVWWPAHRATRVDPIKTLRYE
jgi:putative ABC transport system permease protein